METSPPPKTFTGSDVYSYRGTCSAAPLTLLLIPSMPSTAFNTTATPASIENIRVYLAIAIFIYINIAYK